MAELTLLVQACFSDHELLGAGGVMVINLAGLQAIPTELYEVATIDGASAWRKFWSITLPMISPRCSST